jgi:hypothetical protein
MQQPAAALTHILVLPFPFFSSFFRPLLLGSLRWYQAKVHVDGGVPEPFLVLLHTRGVLLLTALLPVSVNWLKSGGQDFETLEALVIDWLTYLAHSLLHSPTPLWRKYLNLKTH